MQVGTPDGGKLRMEGLKHNRDTVDLFGHLEKIESDEGEEERPEEEEVKIEAPAVLENDDAKKLLPEDDPDNYLEQLEKAAASSKSEQRQKIRVPLEAVASEALVDDGYKSDESFSKEFYMTMHEGLLEARAEE